MVDKPKMHICLITETRIFESALGGVPRFLLSFAGWLLGREQEVSLIGSTFKGIHGERLSANILAQKVQDIESRKNIMRARHPPYFVYLISRFVLLILWITKLFSMNRNSKFSLIHSQDTGFSGLAAVICGKMLSIPVIVSAHGSRFEILQTVIDGRFKRLFLRIEYLIEQFTITLADNILVANPILKEYYSKRSSVPKIQLLPVPINLKGYLYSKKNRRDLRAEFGILDELVVGYVGRFDAEKNLSTLISAFGNVCETSEKIKLVLVGTGKTERDLINAAHKQGLSDKIIFCGMRNDVNCILSSFDIFVLPSYTEGLSVSLLEAMACRRAIICSDIPANRYLLSENEALFIDPYNNSSLASAILKLFYDSTLRESLGKNAYLKAQEYDEEKVFSKLLSYYKEILNLKFN